MNKPTQLLKHDLKSITADLKWASVDLVKIAERLSQSGNETDAWAVLRIVGVLINGEDRIAVLVKCVVPGLASAIQLHSPSPLISPYSRRIAHCWAIQSSKFIPSP
ncbi:hypothetical protein [Pseudomonas delhiensis]|uniref:hypothetical protein n=1 Tax=Pseudomonas delhiensis TaxID=366289 RepID=UPI00315A141E